jgi:hypothetical protein
LEEAGVRLLRGNGGGATARIAKVGSHRVSFAEDWWIFRRSKEEKHFLLKLD